MESAYVQLGPKPISKEDLKNWFTYHPPSANQQAAFAELRHAALEFAEILIDLTPPGADQSVAIRKLRECIMTANASIVCGNKPSQ